MKYTPVNVHLSPHVFSFITENIGQGVGDVMGRNLFNGITIIGHELSELKCTDDTALLSDTKEGSTTLISSVKEHSEKKGVNHEVKCMAIIIIHRCTLITIYQTEPLQARQM